MTRATSVTTEDDPTGDGAPQPVLPDYGGPCISSLYPALATRDDEAPSWIPRACMGARQVVLLVLDGIGWEQMTAFRDVAPTLCRGEASAITSVVPTTTATALTSLTTGRVPAEHGVVGYRLRVHARGGPREADGDGRFAGDGEVLNVLRWRAGPFDVRRVLPPTDFQPFSAFGGRHVPAVTRNEFAATGFTAVHLAGARLIGWAVASTLVVQVKELLDDGEPFVYAYYDGLDKVAHAFGTGDYYAEELKAVDRLLEDLVSVLPTDAVLVVTSDHGQVEVGSNARMIDPSVFDLVEMLSGEGRFRWLHARPGARSELLSAAAEAHGDEAWVMSREQVVSDGWFGGPLRPEVEERLGDVALVAHEHVAFLDPADTGETRLAGRHGSLTAAEMYVPLVAWRAS